MAGSDIIALRRSGLELIKLLAAARLRGTRAAHVTTPPPCRPRDARSSHAAIDRACWRGPSPPSARCGSMPSFRAAAAAFTTPRTPESPAGDLLQHPRDGANGGREDGSGARLAGVAEERTPTQRTSASRSPHDPVGGAVVGRRRAREGRVAQAHVQLRRFGGPCCRRRRRWCRRRRRGRRRRARPTRRGLTDATRG